MAPLRKRGSGAGAGPSPAGRRFFLEQAPSGGAGAPAVLAPSDAEHARVVLRLAAGDRCVGLDGAGSAWPLIVTVADRRRLELEVAGDPTREPQPGEPGAALPWIEVAVALPRGARAETMIDALVQLGAAAVTPLVTQRSPPAARSERRARDDRLHKIAREACKQSGRSWNVELNEPIDVADLCARPTSRIIRLDPRAGERLSAALSELGRPHGTREAPIVIAIGPEGGFAPEEHVLFDAAGTRAACLAPHILRIETAAVAALAVIVDQLHR